MKKQFRVTINISGELELLIDAANAERAQWAADKIADQAHLSRRSWEFLVKDRIQVADLTESIDYEVESVEYAEEEDKEEPKNPPGRPRKGGR
jgi:hypothetical protein